MAYAARVVIPQHRKELKGLPLSVYIALCDTANDSTLVAFPSVFRLAYQVDCKPPHISRATKLLQKMGLIHIKHFKEANNRYLINIPAWFDEREYQFHPATESHIEDGLFEADGLPIPAELDGPQLW